MHNKIFRWLPNIITLIGMCLGISSIKYAVLGNFNVAAGLIVIACYIDGLDGRIARLLNVTSKFGAHLDSFGDIVAFGVAPAITMYLWITSEIACDTCNTYEIYGWIIALLYISCSALRLARFNMISDNITSTSMSSTLTPSTITHNDNIDNKRIDVCETVNENIDKKIMIADRNSHEIDDGYINAASYAKKIDNKNDQNDYTEKKHTLDDKDVLSRLHDGGTKKFLCGIPMPAAAIILMLPLILRLGYLSKYGYTLNPIIMGIYTVLLCLLMISKISTFTLRYFNITKRFKTIIVCCIILYFIGVVLAPWYTLPLIVLFYMSMIPVCFALQYRTEHNYYTKHDSKHNLC